LTTRIAITRRLLREACLENDIAIHAFVLMDNHVHLLLTPPGAEALAVAMRVVGQSYVQFFNYRHGQTGTLWQARLNSCSVEFDRYALMICRYIELNPVRAAMVALPEDYRLSSVHSHIGEAHDPLIALLLTWLVPGATREERPIEYGRWPRAGMEGEEISAIPS